MDFIKDSTVVKAKFHITKSGVIQLYLYTEYTDSRNNQGYLVCLVDGKVSVTGFSNMAKV